MFKWRMNEYEWERESRVVYSITSVSKQPTVLVLRFASFQKCYTMNERLNEWEDEQTAKWDWPWMNDRTACNFQWNTAEWTKHDTMTVTTFSYWCVYSYLNVVYTFWYMYVSAFISGISIKKHTLNEWLFNEMCFTV